MLILTASATLELVRVLNAKPVRVAGQHQEPLRCEVRGYNLQLVAVAQLGIGTPYEVPEGPYALCLKKRGQPPEHGLTLVDAAVLEDAQGPRKDGHPALPGVLQAREVEGAYDLAQLGCGVAGGDQGRHDGPSRGPCHVLGPEAAFFERRVGPDEGDPLQPSALEDQINVLRGPFRL